LKDQTAMLNETLIESILARQPQLTVGVLGDLFLDRYLDLDASLTEPSIETGLDAYQVVRVRSYPGAAGTVINNLAALGVGAIIPVAVIGEDGEGFELRQALDELRVVDSQHLTFTRQRRTPTYTKPMLCERGQPARELNRLDIKNRSPLPPALEERVLGSLEALWQSADAIVVLDQVSEDDCGVVTARVRQRLAELASTDPAKFVLADSRVRIGRFRNVCLKPNERECRLALASEHSDPLCLARITGKPVFCTQGEKGIVVADPPTVVEVPGFPVMGPIDIVGAGDATSAGIVCARAAGASLCDAAAFGCLVASITVQQIGTTGTASPDQVRQRWREVSRP
jgi:bifunctional ADP-heptose synthase (sugar kinase/adenylyltransferase)